MRITLTPPPPMVDSKHTYDRSGEDEFYSLLMRLPSWVYEMAEMAQMGTISPDLTYLADRAERIGRDFELLADSATADVSVRRCAANAAAWLRIAQQLLRNNKDKKTGEELIRLAEIADESDEDHFRPDLLLSCPQILKTSKCCELAAEAATRLLDRPEVNDFAEARESLACSIAYFWSKKLPATCRTTLSGKR